MDGWVHSHGSFIRTVTTFAIRLGEVAVGALKISNTLTGQKEEFKPGREGVVKIFVCGPTIYDYIHVGHARTYIIYDIIARYLSVKGFKVLFTINITDIDDKVFEKAAEEGVDFRELADRYEEAFRADLKALHIEYVTSLLRASEYLSEAQRQIGELLRKGHAYQVNGKVYFDVSTFPDFGRLSHQTPLELKLRRTELERGKKDQADFILWRGWSGKGPSWPSSFGQGRPGWHIEDTAISISTYGPQYDIHGGAVDLVFPHHEAEIAQAESLTGLKPFVRYWVHTGLVEVRGRKMSKSLGNFITLREMLRRHDPDTLRLYLISRHYRERFSFKVGDVERWRRRVMRIRQVVERLKAVTASSREEPVGDEGRFDRLLQRYAVRFSRAMDDDFDTPTALTALMRLVQEVDTLIDAGVNGGVMKRILDKVLEMSFILGLEVS